MRVWSDARIHASVHDHTLLAQSVKVGWIYGYGYGIGQHCFVDA